MSEPWLDEFKDRALEGDRRVAIDIGANTGEWTRWLAQHFDYVIAVEADPRAYAQLLDDLPENVHPMNVAASDRHGVADFYLRPEALQSSLLKEHPIGAGDQSDAPVQRTIGITTLPLDFIRFVAGDRFGTTAVDFVKIDVEGAEALVLAGATPEWFRSTKFLIEVHDTEQAVGEQLRRLCRDDIRTMKHPSPGAHKKHFWVFSDGT
jgi:FkbM family methyltransferase